MFPETSGILLAGGKSARMGEEKATLAIDGQTFLSCQVGKIRTLGIGDIVISGFGEGMVPDDEPGCGPMGGLKSCLRKIKNSSALVLPIDVPLVTTELLTALLTEHEKNEAPVTIVSHQGKIEPLIGVYDRSLLPQMERLLKEKRYSLRALFACCACNVLPWEKEERQFFNCNTPEEYRIISAREQ